MITRVSEISNVTLCKCNRLGLRLGSKYYTHCHFLCCGYIWKTGKPPRSLQEASGKPLGSLKICTPYPPPFCSAHSPMDLWTHSRFHNLLSGITDKTSKWPENPSSIVRLSHEQKIRTFLLFVITISLCLKTALDIILGVLETQVCYICTVYINVRNFTDTRNLLHKPEVKSLFIIFILFLRVVRRGARFSKAPETFRARKAIFSSFVSENGEVYAPSNFFCEKNMNETPL